MGDHEVTTNEIMEFMQKHMVTKADLNESQDSLRAELKRDIRQSEHRILDKVDEKIDNLKGDLVVMLRNEDHKLVALIDILKKKEVLDQGEAELLLKLHPFPQS